MTSGADDYRYTVLKELGDCHAGMGRTAEALDCYAQAIDVRPDAPEPWLGIGTASVQIGDLPRARTAFARALELSPRSAEALSGLAMVHQQMEDYPNALDYYLRCMERDPENLVALLGLFQTSVQMGTFAKVIHYLELYLDKHPGDTSVLFCLATLYARDGRLGDAREALRSVLALEPEKTEAAELLERIDRHRTAHSAGAYAS